MMKKIISLILSVAMLACVAVPAFAASTTYTWTLATAANYDGTGSVGELKAGDIFYLTIKSSAGYKGLSLLLDIDTDVFEVALYDGSDDVADNGNYQVAAVMNPEGMDDKMSFTAITSAGRPSAVNSYLGLQVKEGVTTGDYTIGVSADRNGVFNATTVQANDSENVGNAVTVSVKGIDPAPSNPEINADNNAAVEDANDAKTWAVAVDANYVAAGDKLIATLTNSNFTGEDATQVVELTVGDDVTGGADWAFNLKVRFKDVANRAATTLAIAKAN